MRLLVIKPSSLGDIVHALQVIASVRQQRPEIVISWVVRDRFAPVVRASVDVDTVIEFRRREGWRGVLQVMRALRQDSYDIVWDMQGLLRSGLMTWAARAPSRSKWGRQDGREGSRFFYHPVDPPKGGYPAHAIDILLAFQKTLGLPDTLCGKLRLREGTSFPWFSFFVESAGPVFVLFPDSRGAEKEWKGFERLSRLLLQRRPDARLCWCAGARLDRPGGVPKERFLNLTGCPLEEMVALCGRDAVFIANDSGPLHLSAACGNRVVGIFGPTPPERFGPYPLDDPHHVVVRAPGGVLAALESDVVANAALGLADLDNGSNPK